MKDRGLNGPPIDIQRVESGFDEEVVQVCEKVLDAVLLARIMQQQKSIICIAAVSKTQAWRDVSDEAHVR